jgi:hypothetical protein
MQWPGGCRGARDRALPAMAARLDAEAVDVTVGDFATSTVDHEFRLVYTITNLTSQDEEVAGFRNAAAHLEPGRPRSTGDGHQQCEAACHTEPDQEQPPHGLTVGVNIT